jgi:hypothetical protein
MMKLRFRARGSALVQNFERLEAGIKSFVGRKYVEVNPGEWGFKPTDQAEEVPYRAEYAKACKDGCLYAADAETAAACGVSFDPSFGELADNLSS